METKISSFYTREVSVFSMASPEALKTFTSIHTFLKQLLENTQMEALLPSGETEVQTEDAEAVVSILAACQQHLQKISMGGFPGGAVVENLPANAGDTGSSPGLGGSHMPRSNWAREPQLLSLSVWSLCSATREAAIVRGPRTAMKSGPRLPQLEKALAQKRRPNTAIN